MSERSGDASEDREQLKLERARKAPLRARILDLHEEDPGRSLEPGALQADLRGEFGELSTPHIDYHLKQLRKAGLIPDSGQGQQ